MVKYRIKIKDHFELNPEKVSDDLKNKTLETLGKGHKVKVTYKELPTKFIYAVYVENISLSGSEILLTQLMELLKEITPTDKFVGFCGANGCTIYIKK